MQIGLPKRVKILLLLLLLLLFLLAHWMALSRLLRRLQCIWTLTNVRDSAATGMLLSVRKMHSEIQFRDMLHNMVPSPRRICS